MTIRNRIAAFRRDHLIKALAAAIFIAAAPAASAQSSDGAKGHQYTVTLNSMDYGVIPSGMKVGDTVVFVNGDTVQHSVTAKDHSFDFRLNPKQSATLTLAQAGRIPIYCLFHPMMTGTLNVEK